MLMCQRAFVSIIEKNLMHFGNAMIGNIIVFECMVCTLAWKNVQMNLVLYVTMIIKIRFAEMRRGRRSKSISTCNVNARNERTY